jgi:hypothetical protein
MAKLIKNEKGASVVEAPFSFCEILNPLVLYFFSLPVLTPKRVYKPQNPKAAVNKGIKATNPHHDW